MLIGITSSSLAPWIVIVSSCCGLSSIVIVLADKGRATVVMVKEEYNDKIRLHLDDLLIYVEVEINPTNTLQNKVNSELNFLKEMILVTDEQYMYF